MNQVWTNLNMFAFLQGLQATGDESRQLQAVIEMCQLLVMGNEVKIRFNIYIFNIYVL